MAGPSTWNELIADLNSVLDNFAKNVGEDVVSGNVQGVTDFTKATGTYVNSPTTPWTTTPIPLATGGAVKGGISAIWFKGPVLTKNSFVSGSVTMFSGQNVNNELCRIFIDYDADSGAFSVNIQTGFTGDLPTLGPDETPPAQMTITTIAGEDTISPAQMTITGVAEI